MGVFRTVQPKDEECHDDDEENPRDCEDAIRQGGEAPEVGAESGIDQGTEEQQDDPKRSDPHNQGSDRNCKAWSGHAFSLPSQSRPSSSNLFDPPRGPNES